ncbi:MAG TPA: hypothetical protein VLA21_05825 [Candidatus Limnocylindria bacterium]|nr:hypothetical protein [Candidatus Limnocylindria bacterium]
MARRSLPALLAVLLLLALAGGASAELKKGKVSGGVFKSPDGITFRVPSGFRLARQGYGKRDFFRIVFGGPSDSRGFGPAIVIDVMPQPGNISEYTAQQVARDLGEFPVADVDKYVDMSVLSDKVTGEGDAAVRENLVVFRLDRFSEARVAFSYTYSFSTQNHLVRASYMCFGAQRTLTDDIPKFRTLHDTLVVP